MKKNRVVCLCALLAGVIAFGMRVYGQEKPETAAPHKIVRFGDLKWTPIFKGCDLATVYTAAITVKAVHAREAQILIDLLTAADQGHLRERAGFLKI